MKRSRSVAVLLWIGGVFAGACERAAAPPAMGVALPDACSVALTPGRGSSEHDRAIAALQEQARSGRNRRQALEQLGYRYVARARAANDAGDYTLAEQTAECIIATHPNDRSALLLRGHVLHQMHRFDEAEAIARRLIGEREFVLDYGLLGDTLLDQGRLEEAAEAYQRMIDLKPFFQSYTRAGHLRWLKGDVDGAIELARLAVQAASPRDRESLAWAYTRLAGYELQRSRWSSAARALEAALGASPGYASALLLQGRLALASNRAGDSVEPLRRAARLSPLPEYQWALAEALRLTGDHVGAERIEDEMTARGAEQDPRTVALFLATRRRDAARATLLIERELQKRRDVFTLDAHAWALFAAGRISEAKQRMDEALAAGTVDGRLFLHAAAIEQEYGNHQHAQKWAEKAATVRAMLLPSEGVELDRVRARVAGRSN